MLFPGQDPIDRFSGVSLEPKQHGGRRRTQSQLVLRKLGLGDPEDSPELSLGKVETAYFPNTPADRLGVGRDLFQIAYDMRPATSHHSCTIVVIRVYSTLSRAFIYRTRSIGGNRFLGQGPHEVNRRKESDGNEDRPK